MSGVRVSARALVVAAGAFAVSASVAQAGGLAVREQSASAQGSSFAGSAAGGDLSSMFWNPAALGIAGWGFTTESHYSLILPNSDVTGNLGLGIPCSGAGSVPCSADIGNWAVVPATYASYRLSKDTVFGVSINSPFGLVTKPDPYYWQGGFIAQTSKVFTANVTPTLSHEIVPGLFIGAGIQLEYAKLTLKFMDSFATTAVAEADDHASLGYTAGILWQPSKSTSIGLGYRSSISHDLKGTLVSPSVPTLNSNIALTFETPEVATLSIRQAIAPHTRLLGTIEWSNWSRFDRIPISGIALLPAASLDGPWHDGWMYSVGLEHDINQKLTVRTGVAFEKSPIQNATERLISVPDSDRWWVSGGLTYKWSEKLSFDLAYSHIFFDDAPIDRFNLAKDLVALHFVGKAEQSVDIVSVSIKNKW
jgi:long-chain fatty acid transport protein